MMVRVGWGLPAFSTVQSSVVQMLREQSQIAGSHKMEPQEKLRNLPNHGHLQDVPSQ